jgi:hypothetical protein
MLEAYGRDRWLVLHEPMKAESIDSVIQSLLSQPEVEYLHLRNREAGCYIARIERLPPPGNAAA